MAAAVARGDETDAARLLRAAATNLFRVPDHWGLGTGLERLSGWYVMTQLNHVALCCEATVRLAGVGRSEGLSPRLGRSPRVLLPTRIIARNLAKLALRFTAKPCSVSTRVNGFRDLKGAR